MPGAPFEEAHLLKSLRGRRRLNRFFEEIQYEFAVCFSSKDREAEYSVDGLIERIKQLQESPHLSLRALSIQQRASTGWAVVVLVNLLLLFLASSTHYDLRVAVPAIIVSFLLTVGFFIRAKNSAGYLRRLQIRIENL
jgi:hypothetical protein